MTEKIMAEELVRLFRDNIFDQRSTVCSRIDEGVKRDIGNKAIDSFSSTNKQTDRKNKLGAGTVLEDVSQAKQLVRLVGNYRVCL